MKETHRVLGARIPFPISLGSVRQPASILSWLAILFESSEIALEFCPEWEACWVKSRRRKRNSHKVGQWAQVFIQTWISISIIISISISSALLSPEYHLETQRSGLEPRHIDSKLMALQYNPPRTASSSCKGTCVHNSFDILTELHEVWEAVANNKGNCGQKAHSTGGRGRKEGPILTRSLSLDRRCPRYYHSPRIPRAVLNSGLKAARKPRIINCSPSVCIVPTSVLKGSKELHSTASCSPQSTV